MISARGKFDRLTESSECVHEKHTTFIHHFSAFSVNIFCSSIQRHDESVFDMNGCGGDRRCDILVRRVKQRDQKIQILGTLNASIVVGIRIYTKFTQLQ